LEPKEFGNRVVKEKRTAAVVPASTTIESHLSGGDGICLLHPIEQFSYFNEMVLHQML
jgi:hypothetical protein